MRFTLRDIFAAVFLVALTLLAWRTLRNLSRDTVHAAQVQRQLQSLQMKVRRDNAHVHEAILKSEDEFESIAAMRERAVARVDQLREKYSAMEPRSHDVLSLRAIPAISSGEEHSPVILRLIVPTERSVWLKFGVRRMERSTLSSAIPANDDLLPRSPFTPSGPFERQLSAGDQTLAIVSKPLRNGAQTMIVRLDDQTLVATSFESPKLSGISTSYISAPTQIDIQPDQPLPFLFSGRANLQTDEQIATTETSTHGVVLWFSDRSSDFPDFPEQ